MTVRPKDKTVFQGRGITSRQEITVEIERQEAGHGIVFELAKAAVGAGESAATAAANADVVRVPALSSYVVNTLRNVTLGAQGVRLCIVEHFLCAASLWGLEDLLVRINGPEFPLGDGSAKFWLELFQNAGWERKPIAADRNLRESIVLKKADRILMAVPDDVFSVTYLMDWNHPAIGRCWQTWSPVAAPEEIGYARTFGSLQEHQLLGIADEVVSMTADGFSQPLRWPDEPVRHKLLDLVGDLALAGVNPLSWKARFISIKGGHEMDVELAKRLAEQIQ